MRHLLFILSLFVIVAAPPAPGVQGATPASQVADQRSLAIDGIPISLSPDGAWLAGPATDRKAFCVWNVSTLEPTCDGEVDAISVDTVTWAPDSSAVAFSQDAPRFFVDSDIFVFEVATGTLINLTDDGDAEFSMIEPLEGSITVDLAPSWSPDSQTLVFSRTTYSEDIEDPGTVLMTIPRDGGETEEILRLAPPYPMAVYTTMSWQEDDTILFSVWKADPGDGQNGVWRTSLDGGIDPLIPGTESDEVVLPVIADTQGEAMSLISLGNMYADGESAFWIVENAEAAPVPVEEVLSLTPDTRVLTAPGFSPSGDGIAFVTREADGPFALTIGSLESGEIIAVEEFDSPISGDSGTRGLDWAENDTIFIPTSDGGMLITLAS